MLGSRGHKSTDKGNKCTSAYELSSKYMTAQYVDADKYCH